ncbi:alanine--tRNA ligase [Silvibacterium dinghuense]|uniref:Alanine--tRNA ligase n=1 Tax=Silvibacterium dinghuense TaxID=1560006 RepID=A0A4V1NUW7_9BACT|nr:alanine--tRNA ligase [Silvibacterium dinghuense]RXS93694.1 alanine--tRNA ligase [Silvibacterium dinghuense]GGH06878.1 alanine--tRNA ligase [Silvibacterium dinghuense]
MQYRSGSDIRETFLRFFETKGHRRVHSSSLVPANDPTLLFTNAGMNQFKDVFLGVEHRDYNRATTSQKCVRAGGKHNDLENVGFTRRHHTFFEMLGNFSFGDYFKKDAIAYAWELVTSPEWFGIPKDRLYVTIFKGENGVPRDEEAYKLWLETGVPAERIFEMGAKDNFWQMGDTGPCGPCSEIFYDMGIEAAETPGVNKPFGEDDARYVEIWNLVFMQFDRSANGELALLPKPSIDTGAGLERMASVMQGVLSNFETDLFTPLIKRAAELTAEATDDRQKASLRIIADHARAATFLISDGVLPANEGRGYVLRKILRRGIRHGRLLGQDKPFMREMVYAVRDEMAGAYPELNESADRVAKVVEAEERQFARVLEIGARQLDQLLAKSKDTYARLLEAKQAEKNLASMPNEALAELSSWFGRPISEEDWGDIAPQANPSVPGDKAFHLYETFGLPLDFMTDAAHDAGIHFDLDGFEAARAEEQARARASWKGGAKQSASPVYRELAKTDFEGYKTLRVDGAEVLAIVKDGVGVPVAAAGDAVEIVLNNTSFYADSGGQVGDRGWLYSDDHNAVIADVSGCTKPVQGVFAHKAVLRAPLAVGAKVDTVVDADFRYATQRNHTATHLLHAALREVLGKHVKQAGSLNDPTRLRFDFSHFAPIADEELADVESLINKEVLGNTKVDTIVDVPIDVAVNEYHAMALFGEKYGERVRVVKIGDFSTELCGGTHTGATGEIGVVKLIGEGSVSSGVRRVEAVTGLGALDEFRRGFAVAQLASQFAPSAELTPAESLRVRLASQEDELKKLRRELDEARMKSAASSLSNATDSAVEVKGIKVLSQRVDALDRGQMRTLVDNLRNKLGSGVVVLGSADGEGKVAIIVGVTKDLTAKVQAGKVVGQVAKLVGGSGGGRPDMAEAGGKDASQLDAALASAVKVVGELLG